MLAAAACCLLLLLLLLLLLSPFSPSIFAALAHAYLLMFPAPPPLSHPFCRQTIQMRAPLLLPLLLISAAAMPLHESHNAENIYRAPLGHVMLQVRPKSSLNSVIDNTKPL